MNFPLRRGVLLVLAAIPFVLIPVGSAWSVRPLAQIAARWCDVALAGITFDVNRETAPRAPERTAGVESADGPREESTLSGPPLTPSPAGLRARNERAAPPTAGPTARRRALISPHARANVFVGPDSIQRAIPVGGRPTSSWTHHTPEHPAGLLIQSPGALAGVIEPGDILVEAEGQALRSFEQLLVTVKQAYERRVKRLSGRIFRKGDLVPVTVEPGW